MTDSVATNETIVVVGGGISGMTAAIEAAECGKQVVLLEKSPSLGGRVSQLYKYFPKMCHPTCGLEINLRRLKANNNIKVMTMSEVTKINGDSGNYTLEVKVSPRYVNENCTACGACTEAVETEFPDEFNYGMKNRKGAYLAHNMAYPQRYVLDTNIIGTEDADKAKAACPVAAVELDMVEENISLNAGAIIWATGWTPFDANKIQPYGYDRYANVVTNVEFERMMDPFGPTGGKILRPSDNQEAKNVAFIQCAGSRDRNYLKHCSRICCMASLKHANYMREQYGDADDYQSTIYYIDIRAIDRIDDFHQKVKADPNVTFIKSKVANIQQNSENQNPVLHGVNTEGYHRYAEEHDLVVLATGMEPSVKADDFGLKGDNSGFIEMDAANGGLFATGVATEALDVNRSVQSATASALRAIQVINRVSAAEG